MKEPVCITDVSGRTWTTKSFENILLNIEDIMEDIEIVENAIRDNSYRGIKLNLYDKEQREEFISFGGRFIVRHRLIINIINTGVTLFKSKKCFGERNGEITEYEYEDKCSISIKCNNLDELKIFRDKLLN